MTVVYIPKSENEYRTLIRNRLLIFLHLPVSFKEKDTSFSIGSIMLLLIKKNRLNLMSIWRFVNITWLFNAWNLDYIDKQWYYSAYYNKIVVI